MKKVITLVIVAIFTSATFAQDSKMQQAPAKQMEKKEVKPADKMEKAQAENAPMKMKHECYMMENGALMHCMGDNSEPQKAEVKLRNGSMIMTDGTMKTKDGKTVKLENGQCVSVVGVVGKCDQMHARMNGMKDKMAPTTK